MSELTLNKLEGKDDIVNYLTGLSSFVVLLYSAIFTKEKIDDIISDASHDFNASPTKHA